MDDRLLTVMGLLVIGQVLAGRERAITSTLRAEVGPSPFRHMILRNVLSKLV